MRKPGIIQFVLSARFRTSLAYMDRKQRKVGKGLFFICILMPLILMFGCSSFNGGSQAKATFAEANDLFNQGNYKASLNKYEQIIEKYPTTGDRVLFEMGIIYAH